MKVILKYLLNNLSKKRVDIIIEILNI